MKYPATVIVVAVIVTIILMVKVVPVFQDLFSSFGADLPAFTQMVVNMSNWMQKYWFILIIAIAALIFGFLEAKKRSQKFRDALDRMALKLPILVIWSIKQLLPVIAVRWQPHLQPAYHLLMHWNLLPVQLIM